MNIFDFITQDELDDLDHDYPNGLHGVVRHAQRRLNQFVKAHDSNDQADWNLMHEARQSFMNVVIAAA